MPRITRSIIFWFAFFAIFIVTFLAFINTGKIYSSEMEILLIPKNTAVAQNMEQITSNAQSLPLGLSFYDEVTKNPDVDDTVKELPANKRKEFWDSSIKTEKVDGSGIVKITNFNADRVQAEVINRQTVSTLIARISQYYDINKDLDVRIIEEPVVGNTFSLNIYLSLIYSLLAGLAVGFVTSFVFSIFPEPAPKWKNKARIQFTAIKDDPWAKFSPIAPKEEIFPKKETPKEKPAEPIKFDKKPVTTIFPQVEKVGDKPIPGTSFSGSASAEKKASAPGNLPVADEEEMDKVEEKLYSGAMQEKINESPASTDSDKSENDVFREASPEEVKARLNKLLGRK